jgi:hypothetical protein
VIGAGADHPDRTMIRHCVAIAIAFLTTFSYAERPSLPSSFQAKTIHSPEGADIYVRWGGTGAVVVLLHGYAENSDSWAPLAVDLMKDHTVVVPDLRGIGRSSNRQVGTTRRRGRTSEQWSLCSDSTNRCRCS